MVTMVLDQPNSTGQSVAGLPDTGLSDTQLASFAQDGFLILRSFAPSALQHRLQAIAEQHLREAIPPLEYEADLHYPGAPASRGALGGRTIRRLLQAQARDPAFTEWITHPELLRCLHQLLGEQLVMPLAHHNCVMTKQPRFSSDTGWHQDIRYWSFERPELINIWLALGPERPENGGLRLIPGSHRLALEPYRFDAQSFFREDLAENQALLSQAVTVELNPGDVLLFHCRSLHAATRNYSHETKFSFVFTVRPADNPPHPGTRSTSLPELLLP